MVRVFRNDVRRKRSRFSLIVGFVADFMIFAIYIRNSLRFVSICGRAREREQARETWRMGEADQRKQTDRLFVCFSLPLLIPSLSVRASVRLQVSVSGDLGNDWLDSYTADSSFFHEDQKTA